MPRPVPGEAEFVVVMALVEQFLRLVRPFLGLLDAFFGLLGGFLGLVSALAGLSEARKRAGGALPLTRSYHSDDHHSRYVATYAW